MKRGANGTRTRNPLLAKQVRYQLRHGPLGEDPHRFRQLLVNGVGDLGPRGPLHAGRLEPEPRGIPRSGQERKDRG